MLSLNNLLDTNWSRASAGNSLQEVKNKTLQEIKKIINEKKFLIKNEIKTNNIALLTHKFNDNICNSFKEMLLSTSLSAELFSADIINDIFTLFFNDSKEKILQEITLQLKFGGLKPTKQDLHWLMKKHLSFEQIKYVQEALDLAGFGGKIHISKTNNSMYPVVRKTIGYNFDFQVLDVFQNKKLIEPRVLIFDGFVESIGEIHSILEKSFESKESMIFFHRGMSNDVLNTLVQNWNRGTLRILPIQVQYDLEGMNTLNDLSIIAGSDIISSLKGQLLSMLSYCELQTIDECQTNVNQISLINKKTQQAVIAQQNFLYQKRLEVHQDVTSFYDKRLRSLSQGLVTIFIPDSHDFFIKKQNIDRFLRSYRSLIEFGTINVFDDKMLSSTAIAITKFLPILESQINDLGSIVIEC